MTQSHSDLLAGWLCDKITWSIRTSVSSSVKQENDLSGLLQGLNASVNEKHLAQMVCCEPTITTSYKARIQMEEMERINSVSKQHFEDSVTNCILEKGWLGHRLTFLTLDAYKEYDKW